LLVAHEHLRSRISFVIDDFAGPRSGLMFGIQVVEFTRIEPTTAMIVHYFSIALRHLIKNRLYSAITILGLAVGLSSVFLIVNYLRFELSFDRFHEGAENIYRIAWENETPQTRTPHPMAQAMVRDFPEVESAVSITPIWGPGLIRQTFSVRNLEKNIRFDESNVMEVDSTFFKVFTFPLIKGDPKTVLKNPGGFLISESMARKYFGQDDPVGKHLAVNDDQQLIEVLGVFKDVPRNSHFHFDALVSYVREKAGDPNNDYYSWNDFGHYNYIRLKPGADAKKLESRLLDWIPKYRNWSPQDIQALKDRGYGFRLQPLTDIHLRSNLHWELESNGNISYVYMMTTAAVLILIIACLNFINLSTAQSTERAKEIGIRKSLGAFRRQLSAQFTGEAILVAGLAVLLSILLIEFVAPAYSAFTGNPLSLTVVNFIVVLAGSGLLVGILAGAYPAWYLSRIQPGLILKGKFIQNPKGSTFRKSFMVFQFFASMVLISCSLVIAGQLNYIRHKSLGFAQDEVVVLPIKNRHTINPRFQELQSELLRIPGVRAVSATSNIPGRSYNQNAIFPATDPEQRVNASENYIDYDFFKTLDIRMAEGRPFLKENPADGSAFVINETAARNLFPDGALGKELAWDSEQGLFKGTIIGITRDFHYQSLHEPVRPIVFRLGSSYNYVVLKLHTDDLNKSIAGIRGTWKKFDDDFGFEFSFLSGQLNEQYAAEQNMAGVLIVFSVLAVSIACVGLLGMAALTFRQKTKEVSVRKVLGATLVNLMVLLLRDFTQLVLLSIALAVPFVWWLMNQWLENFAFRMTINPWVFVASGFLLLAVTWSTLSYLTLRIARVNPAETLKSE
jgi:putative ABC transport system permease protein